MSTRKNQRHERVSRRSKPASARPAGNPSPSTTLKKIHKAGGGHTDQQESGNSAATVYPSYELFPLGDNWKAVLSHILHRHGKNSLDSTKHVSTRTIIERHRSLMRFWKDLRTRTKFREADPRVIKSAHVEALVDLWRADGLSLVSIKQQLSHLRVLASWLKRTKEVGSFKSYLTPQEQTARRASAALMRDKSWSTNNVNADVVIAQVEAIDPTVGLQLRLCKLFGLRVREALHFRPHESVVSCADVDEQTREFFPQAREFLRIKHGTKGGRLRFVPIRGEIERFWIERCKSITRPGEHISDRGRTEVQNRQRFYRVVAKAGITMKALGVTAHGLRHERLCDLYEEIANKRPPVRGGVLMYGQEMTARLAVANFSGHGRHAVTNAYLGPASRGRKAQSRGVAAEPAKAGASPADEHVKT